MKLTFAVVTMVGLSAIGFVGLRTTVSAQAKTQWDGIYTEDQAKRGQAVYAESCAACHGPDMTGGEMAPGLAGSEFTANWNDLSIADLMDRIRTSMPQNAPGSLSRPQAADIVAFILKKNNAPAGQTELPAQGDTLSSIKLSGKK